MSVIPRGGAGRVATTHSTTEILTRVIVAHRLHLLAGGWAALHGSRLRSNGPSCRALGAPLARPPKASSRVRKTGWRQPVFSKRRGQPASPAWTSPRGSDPDPAKRQDDGLPGGTDDD